MEYSREQLIERLQTNLDAWHTENAVELMPIEPKPDKPCLRDIVAELVSYERRVIGRWKQLKGAFTTPGGTPYYVCGACGGSGHLNGCEYPRRKVICDTCGRINLYPWERAYEEGSSLWEDDEEEVKQDGSIV